ncbi:MAG: efflux RND transporter periplasmic adaptor subunit [Blastocatellia bacterium]|nr:efflux RND transporter periplasmic adaptor subunit [Blastocatellia bacterium]
MHLKSYFVVVSLLISLVSCSGKQPEQTLASSIAKASPPPTSMISYTLTSVIERSLAKTIEITGTLEGQEEVVVSSEIEGRIAEVYFDFGSQIKTGDTLLKLDTREFEMKVAQAEATVASAEARLKAPNGDFVKTEEHPEVRQVKAAMDQAKAEFERAEKLIDKGDISKQTYDQIKAQYDQVQARLDAIVAQIEIYRATLAQSRAQLDIARKQLSDCIVKAPITGFIKERLASKGEYLTKGKNVARIVQIDPLRLRADVPEQYINDLYIGQKVSFQVDSITGSTFEGKLTRLSPSVDKQSRSLKIEATIYNSKLQLKPGLFARASINLSSNLPALVVPAKAVITASGLSKLYILDNNRVSARVVRLGQKDGELIEIVEGVKAEEQVILCETPDKLEDGLELK